jgi:hypothetical protein
VSVVPLEPGRCDRRLRFDDLNLLVGLKCIEYFVAQVVMSDCEEHFYDGAFQGFIDVPWFHESFVSIDSYISAPFSETNSPECRLASESSGARRWMEPDT